VRDGEKPAMQTEVLRVDPVRPEEAALRRAADVLRGGGLVAFPTETVYGLGANALDAAAVARIFAAKGRPPNNPLIVHVADAEAARPLAAAWTDIAARLAERFWPGPLTLVVPRSEVVPDVVTAGGPTVALRVPAHGVAHALLQAANLPIAAPSANLSSNLSPTRAEHVLRDLDGRIDLVLDGGPTPGGLESTVLDVTALPPRLLRPGLVLPAELAEVIGPIHIGTGPEQDSSESLLSPGMLRRHYAPRAPLECVTAGGRRRVEQLCAAGMRVGWLAFDEPGGPEPPGLVAVVMPHDAAAYAARLYAVLHDLDQAGVERIVVAEPPDDPAWLAVRDRLRRAAVDAEVGREQG
jgi:L-threonylcarbamoyladenylate synthase